MRTVPPASALGLAGAALALALALLLPRAAPSVAQPPAPACIEQAPQDFLIRGNYVDQNGISRAERRARRLVHQQAIRYRTERYGHFSPFGQVAWNARAPSHYAVETTFFDLEVRMHARVVPALACVEAAISADCGATPYAPEIVRGIRGRNTFDPRSHEVSNHVYGIAIDIDAHRNVCCGCQGRRQNPACTRDVDSVYERMEMPECWVHAFERYGFYWLGNDRLMDMMHFEFLGDPDRIVAE